jgi:NtrC-family two-component system sensor histidine kinase KinB
MVASLKVEPANSTRRGHLELVREDVSGLLAHDLKSPLSAIAMNIDFALAELGTDVPAAVRGALEDGRESSQRAVGIVTDMFDAVQLASGELRPQMGPVDAQARLARAVRRIAAGSAARGIQLTWTADAVHFRGDSDLLDRSLDRLLERAQRYARVGGGIDVTLESGTIVIRVSPPEGDSEPPSPEDTMRSLATHFADAAMRAQGGAVWIESEASGALLFVIALPA